MNLDSISIRGEVLIVEYSVHSYSSDQVYLLNNLYRSGSAGNIRIDPDSIYAYRHPGAPLSLCKQFLPAPDGIAHDRLEIPLASLLEPGWMMTETIRLPLPIQVNHPYLEAKDGRTISADKFTFTIGYVLAKKDGAPIDTITIGETKYVQFDYDYLLTHQRLKRSQPVILQLT